MGKLNIVVNDNVLLGYVVYAARVRSGITQSDMANKLEVSHSQYSRLETGVTELGVLRLERIAYITGTTIQGVMESVYAAREALRARGVKTVPNGYTSSGVCFLDRRALTSIFGV